MPPLVVVGPELAGRTGLLAEALGERRGTTVEVRAAERGDKRRLRELAERNARLALAQDKLRRERRRRERTEALAELAEALGMEEVPIRIEGYDISNLGPEHTVASMVVFEGGAAEEVRLPALPDPRQSRAASDDFASMNEVLARRLARYVDESEKSPHDAELDESFAALPDLIMIDGGKGQLAAGVRALQPLIERGTTVISLAKRLEEVYVPGRSTPLPIRADSEASRLLQRVRDEAHRFALDLHRRRRGKAMTGSVLDGLRGVGPARKRALLSHFGSPERFLDASARGDRGGSGHPRQARPRHPPAAQQGGLTVALHNPPAVPEAVISVRGLRKSYGELEALRGIDLDVARGEIFAFLGPNGAGKTTAISVLEGYLERDAGEVEVLGEDPAAAGRDWRGRVGFVLQECRMEPLLTVRETLEMYAGYYAHAARRSTRRSSWSGSPRRPTTAPAGSPAASSAASTSPSPSSATPSCSSSTSRPPASTPPPAARPGRSSRASATSARP